MDTRQPRKPGRPRSHRPLMLREAGDLYTRYLVAEAAADRSVENVEKHMRTLERILGWELDLNHLAHEHILQFKTVRRAEGVEGSTINAALAILRTVLRYSVEPLRRLPVMPITIKLERVDEPLVSILSDVEYVRLLEAANEGPLKEDSITRTALVILIAGFTGFRHREICNLQWRNIDFQADEIKVQKKKSGKRVIRIKNRKERSLPLHPILKAALLAYRKASNNAGVEWMFPGQHDGKPKNDFFVHIRAAFKLAGLYDTERRPGLHCLRRTFATSTLAKVDVQTVRDLGGWSDLNTVLKYVTTTDERKRKAIDGLYGMGVPVPPAASPVANPNAAILAKLAETMTSAELAEVARKLLS